MTINTAICFILTLMFVSGLYKRIMIKSIRRNFEAQDEYDSFCDYGIEKACFKPFSVMKFLRLSRVVNSNFYYKFMSKLYLFQVLISIIGFIGLFILNYFDSLDILKIKF